MLASNKTKLVCTIGPASESPEIMLTMDLINNDGYTIERVISDRPYNDIQPWRYHKLGDVFGGTLGLDVRTEGELEDALGAAAKADGLVFIEVHTGRMDCPESLRSAGRSMAKTNKLD